VIVDPGVPVRDLLLGSNAADMLDVVLSEVGGTCTAARPVQVRYVPGSSITVQYEATVQWGNEPDTTETLVALNGVEIPAGTATVEIEGSKVAFWRYPNDPFLPGLPLAAEPEAALDLLDKLGAPGKKVQLRRRAYRPGRRAVIEVVSAEARLFLKIVRPSRAKKLQEIHRAAAAHVAVPHSYGWAEDLGLVAIQAFPGETLRKALTRSEPDLPDGRDLVDLLDRLSGVPRIESHRPGPVDRASDHARLLTAVVPSLGERLESLVGRLTAEETDSIVVHGDFHASQVITANGSIVGLIDLDTIGTGARANDLATMLGQISTLTRGRHAEAFGKYGETLVRYFDRLVDPSDLRLRAAAVVLGFATGPFRVQQMDWVAETERRVDLAEQWLDSAESARRIRI
jgi:hypothetical protein